MRAGSPFRLTARQRTTLLALVLLPALALRALVPVGFMPVVDDTGIHIGFCPGEAQPPGALAGALAAGHGAHAAHHHDHGGANHGSPAPVSHPPCLFALSASPAFTPAAPTLAPPPPAAAALAADSSSRVSVPAIVRAQSSRGPPFLA
ncbi:MAG TPA: hypothetical protein VM713_00205 [Steroidobacteraceae bacterium]|nr:hypothetical protein [Steroidobacteraceae bacterium]